MKKFLGLILAGVMVMSLTVVASASSVVGSVEIAPGVWQTAFRPSGTSPSYSITREIAPGVWQTIYFLDGFDSEAAALAEELGISINVMQDAEAANKSVGEYLNNAVNGVAGVENAIPVAQGGNVIINGEPSNQTFSVNKPLPAHIDAAKAQAVTVGGRVMNCVDVDAGVCFDVATVNFYTPGITGTENVQVYHFAGGQWLPLNVAEVREDHIVVDMTAPGILAFIEIPAEAAAE